jgi:hypothetical protein
LVGSDSCVCYDLQKEDQISETLVPGSSLLLLNKEQDIVVSQVIHTVIHESHQLMFPQGSAGRAQTFAVRALIAALQSRDRKCTISGTTGIAVVPYPGGITLHSLFSLGMMNGLQEVSSLISAAIHRRLGRSLPLIWLSSTSSRC